MTVRTLAIDLRTTRLQRTNSSVRHTFSSNSAVHKSCQITKNPVFLWLVISFNDTLKQTVWTLYNVVIFLFASGSDVIKQERLPTCPPTPLYVHLWKLGSSSSGNLCHTELGQLIFQVVQLLEQLLLLLAPQISCLDLGLKFHKTEFYLLYFFLKPHISVKDAISGGISSKSPQFRSDSWQTRVSHANTAHYHANTWHLLWHKVANSSYLLPGFIQKHRLCLMRYHYTTLYVS